MYNFFQQQLWDTWRALTKERDALHVAQRRWKVETDMLAIEEALETQVHIACNSYLFIYFFALTNGRFASLSMSRLNNSRASASS